MRYGIFSDIHSNLEALETVIHAYKNEAIDTYLCVGDVVGYAANPNECVEKVRQVSGVTVAGNHDWASVNLFAIDYFIPIAREAVLWTAHHLDEKSAHYLQQLSLLYKNEGLTLVHGTLEGPEDFNYMTDGYTASKTFALLDTDVCFVGHTHVAEIFVKDKDNRIYYQEGSAADIKEGNKYIINVGSVGQPRDGNPKAAYCIYDTGKKTVQIKRIDYDIHKTREKIIAEGLPRFMGERLLIGR